MIRIRISRRGRGLLVRTPAKINLVLEVLRRRPDGYHDIDSVFQAIGLWDSMVVTPRREGTTIACRAPGVPTGPENTIWKAVEALRAASGRRDGVAVRLTKRIPSGGGLGGGSGNAAGVLLALDRLWGLRWPAARLGAVAARVGSDVPYFLRGGTARCRGRGERVKALPGIPGVPCLLVVPPFGLSTGEVYRRLKVSLTSPGPVVSLFLNRFRHEGRMPVGGIFPFNRLEAPAFDVEPRLRRLKDELARRGWSGIWMTGSGSTLVCPRASWAGLDADRVRLSRMVPRGVRVIRPDRA